MHRIMIIDDEENILNSLKRILKKEHDFEIVAHTNLTHLGRSNREKFHLFYPIIECLQWMAWNY